MYNTSVQPDINNKQSVQDPHQLDFIMQTEVPKPKSFWSRLKSKTGAVFIALSLVLISILVAIPLILQNQANNDQLEKLVSVAQSQTEIIRIARLAESQAKESTTKSRASNIVSTMEGSLGETKVLLQKRNADTQSLVLEGKKNSQTDSTLVDAIQNNNFDTVFSDLIDQKLLEYQSLLLEVQQTSNKDEKGSLEKAYTDVNDLLGLFDEAQEE